MSDYQDALRAIKTILDDPAAFRGGEPQWKSPEEADTYLTKRGFRLTNAETMGPKGLADGQQFIYEGPNNVHTIVHLSATQDAGRGTSESTRQS